MSRSFTDRVLGGVCGGLATGLPLNAWTLRLLFAVFSMISLGIGVVLYIALWWLLPQESLIEDATGSPFRVLLMLIVALVLIGVWVGDLTGALVGPADQPLLWPVALVTLSMVFLLQQVRG